MKNLITLLIGVLLLLIKVAVLLIGVLLLQPQVLMADYDGDEENKAQAQAQPEPTKAEPSPEVKARIEQMSGKTYDWEEIKRTSYERTMASFNRQPEAVKIKINAAAEAGFVSAVNAGVIEELLETRRVYAACRADGAMDKMVDETTSKWLAIKFKGFEDTTAYYHKRLQNERAYKPVIASVFKKAVEMTRNCLKGAGYAQHNK